MVEQRHGRCRAAARPQPVTPERRRKGQPVNATEATTRPASHADPALAPTDPLSLPSAAPLQDARRAALELGMPPTPDAADEAPLRTADLVGHEFLDCVERGPLGEVWKVRAPDGRLRLAHRLTRVGPV